MVTLAAIGTLVFIADWPAFLSILRRIPLQAVVLAFFFGGLTHALLGARWHVIAGPTIPGGFWFHLGVYWRASVLGLLTPGSLGTDAYRILAMGSPSSSRATITGLVVRERFVGLSGYLLSYLAALPFVSDPNGVFTALALPVALLLILLLTAWRLAATASPLVEKYLPARFAQVAGRISAGLRAASGGGLVYSFALTFGACATWFALVYVIATGLAPGVSFAFSALSAVLAELVRIVPLSVQGVGVRESAFGYAFHAGGSSLEVGVATGILAYVIYNLVVGMGGVAMSFAGQRKAT